MAEDIATHPQPVWREKANFLIFADLTEHGMEGRWEQLWAAQQGEDEFILCCLPFFAYGLALGDRVRTVPRRGKKYVVGPTLERSGRELGRLWLGDVEDRQVRDEVEDLVRRRGWLHEWSSPNLLALDLPQGAEAELQAFLAASGDRTKILYERGSGE